MNLVALNRATLARQMLLDREPLNPVAALERLGGLQAQDPMPPFLALRARIREFVPEALRAAVGERSAVRATLLRGTLHLVSAGDYLALRPVLAEPLARGLRALGDRAEGLEPDRVLAAATEILHDAPRTFGELRAALVVRFPTVHERALGFTVRMLLPLVMVPNEERWGWPRDARFALAEDWLGRALGPGSREHLVRRYLAAFGPATPADAQAWSGLRGLAPVFSALRDELVMVTDDRGRELYDLPDAPRPDPGVPAPPRLLGAFDGLLLAHADRTRVIDEAHRPRVVTKNLRVKPVLLVEGRVAGTWQSVRRRGVLVVTLEPFAAVGRVTARALEAEAEAVAQFVDPDARAVTVAWTEG